jgi:hypothetical protein
VKAREIETRGIFRSEALEGCGSLLLDCGIRADIIRLHDIQWQQLVIMAAEFSDS